MILSNLHKQKRTFFSNISILKQLCFFLTLILPTIALAAANQPVTLQKYYQAQCSQYTGTWHGFFTDPTGLFGNGGPWPVSVSLYNQGNKIIGMVNSKNAPNYVSSTMKGKFWAHCHQGVLSDIFLGKSNQCGAFSQEGLLVSKNVLVLKINYQNAMNGTTFLVFLQRVNDKYSGTKPAGIDAMTFPKPESCQ